MALTTDRGQGLNEPPQRLLKELWHEIEDKLGDITDLQIIPVDMPHFKYKLSYKSNGILKEDYFSSLAIIITSLYYVNELNSPIKKYKHSSLNPQHIL